MESFKNYLNEDLMLLSEELLDISKIEKYGLLSISDGNAKIPFKSLNLPAGYSCPFAVKCKSMAIQDTNTGKWSIQDAIDMQYRCYAASDEARYLPVSSQRQKNFAILKRLKNRQEMAKLIYDSLLKEEVDKVSKYFRLHVSGDFFSQEYFDAWIAVARKIPDTVFYCYTKSIPFWINRLSQIPNNLKLTASYGGKYDAMIEQYNLKYVMVVDSVNHAKDLGLEIDIDDTHAYKGDSSFALLLHNIQPKGIKSKASKLNASIIKNLKTNDISYDFDFPKEV